MKLDEILKGSYQRYSAEDFLSTAFFNKRIALVVDGVKEIDVQKIKDKLLDVYGDVAVTIEKTAKTCKLAQADLTEILTR